MEVDAQNLRSLLQLVVIYDHMEVLKGNIQEFMAFKWKELAESGLVTALMKDERFTQIGAAAVTKYSCRDSELSRNQ